MTATAFTERHMDEIDAAKRGREWLDDVRLRRCPDQPVSIEQIGLRSARNGVDLNGGVVILWGRADRFIAQYSIVRDSANFALLACVEAPQRDDD